MNTQTKTSALLAVLVATLGVVSTARAGVLYTTGFEAPAMTPGPLAPAEGFLGQDNWTIFGDTNMTRYNVVTGTVGAGTVKAGTQALRMDAGASTVEALQPLNIDPVALGYSAVSLSYDMKLSVAATPSFRWGARFYDNVGNLLTFGMTFGADGLIRVDNGFGPVITSTPVTRGVWQNVQIILNYSTATWDAYLDGNLVQGGNSFDTTNGLADFDLYHAHGTTGATDFMLVDNFTVTATAVPEPAGWGMVLPVAVLAGSRRRR